MLDEKNPRGANGHRKHKMHQFLTDQIGLPAVRGHIWQVIGIGNASKDKDAFERGCKRAFPQVGDQGELLELY